MVYLSLVSIRDSPESLAKIICGITTTNGALQHKVPYCVLGCTIQPKIFEFRAAQEYKPWQERVKGGKRFTDSG